ncbi:MAG: NAD(P)-binding protein [Alphaproteobacteria bacterium]|jgi:squalene-associated FAD-dependent desaturase|nr:NAD(P)-binding protein [Alphaproteobacteria bacterium]
MTRLHVVGAGIAGLAAATAAATRGVRVVLWEAAPQAGGRCRSFDDARLGRRIDNGNHLVLSGNRATAAYLDRIGGRGEMHEIAPAAYPFVDLATGERWTLRPGRGPVPLWLADPARRPPGTRLGELGRGLGLLWAGRRRAAAAVLGDGTGYARFWDPLVTAVLNTDPAEAAAHLMRPVLLETFARGEPACRPVIARTGLDDALVAPALRLLRDRGAEIRLGARVDGLDLADDGVRALHAAGERVELTPSDGIVLATPPWITAELVPDHAAPAAYSPIVNAHFALAEGGAAPPALVGLVGGAAQWIFRRPGLASVTVSAADALVDLPADELARRFWPEVRRALDLGDAPLPAFRIIKEKRATPRQTPAAAARRWPTRTRWRGLALAGDWIDTGLPATIESAVRSGEAAVRTLARGVAPDDTTARIA